MKSKKLKAILATAGLALTLGVSAAFGGCSAVTPRDGINGKDLNIYDIYEAAKTESGNPDLTFTEFLKEYLSYNPEDIATSVSLQTAINRSLMSSVSIQTQFTESGRTVAYSGSGVILDVDRASGDMTVVTNCHVVYSAKSKRYSSDNGYPDSIYLWLYGSESNYTQTNKNNAIPATLIAASKTYDVAVIKVTGSDLIRKSQATAASWSDAEEVYLGETVFAVGNANSQQMSANVGYVSKDSELIKVDLGDENGGYDYTVLRTSAAINSGNSGGGLYNLGCEIVGLVNAKGKTDATGFGYALPAASTRRVVDNLLDGASAGKVNRVSRFKHGLNVEVTDMYSTGLNKDGFAEIYEQVTVASPSFGSPFYGKISGDDVLKRVKITRGNTVVEDIEIRREHNFHDVMLSVREGDTVEITVMRGEDEITASVTANGFENLI